MLAKEKSMADNRRSFSAELPPHTIASNQYGKYCVPESSSLRPAAALILEGGVWEPRTIAFIRENCGAGDVVHAGAYFGDFLPGISTALARSARLWAFEPARENFACARETATLNGLTNVTLLNAALGDSTGIARLCVGSPGMPSKGGTARLVHHQKEGFLYEEAQVAKIDEVIPADRSVSILQLDVEGYEQQALAGAIETIRRCRPILIVEHLPKDRSWFEAHILPLGYSISGKLHSNIIVAPTDNLTPTEKAVASGSVSGLTRRLNFFRRLKRPGN
jgi:FkbM family methyltransferase